VGVRMYACMLLCVYASMYVVIYRSGGGSGRGTTTDNKVCFILYYFLLCKFLLFAI
jgi:hypothetical protein